MDRPKAFLRWVGGKARRASLLAERVPDIGLGATYFEPFLGGASVYFATAPPRAVLSDSNADLMNTFEWVKRDPQRVWKHLGPLVVRRSQKDYYTIRGEYNRMRRSSRKAAYFIYLNKMCFNGVFRVNRDGEFNVPFGGKPNPAFPSRSDLVRSGGALDAAELRTADFETVTRSAQIGDFVYLDPPYLPVNGTSSFRHYTRNRFDETDHIRLADAVYSLTSKRVRVMITMGDLPITRELYGSLTLEQLSIRRYVGSNGDRKLASELLITNY